MNTDKKNQLVLLLLDGEISEDDFQTLQTWLLNDEETRRIYQDHVMTEYLMEKGSSFVSPSLRRFEIRPQGLKKSLWAAAACLMALMAVTLLIKASSPPIVAQLRFTKNSSYQISGSSNSRQLRPGDELQIAYGAVELTLPRQVAAIVVGPARLRLQDDLTLILDEGLASFTVPPEGHGFQVITPHFNAVDLGTQFAVISGWNQHDEVHVTKGQVQVSPKQGLERLLTGGQALSVSADGLAEEIAYTSIHFQPDLPKQAAILIQDNFEQSASGKRPLDGLIELGLPPAWQPTGETTTKHGIFNPSGNGKWYRADGLKDDSSPGVMMGMKGSALGFFISDGRAGLERVVTDIEDGYLYTVGLTLGVRSSATFHHRGYEIALVSGDTVLASKRSNRPPSGPNTFTRINFSWNSSELPNGVALGDQMKIRLISPGTGGAERSYLDFDHLEVSMMRYTQVQR